jgi:NitT/TauT family transport system permease protein
MSDRRGRLSLRDSVTSALLVTGVALIGLIVWTKLVHSFDLPKVLLPTPRQCLLAAEEHRTALLYGTWSTGLAAVTGLLTAVGLGSSIAILFSQSRQIRLALFPYAILLQTVPIVAVAPLLIIWSGYTFRTVVIVTVIVCLFPIINSVTTGLLAIDREMSDLFRLYGASRGKRLLYLQIPTAIKHLVLGTKTSAGLAVIGAIVAEFFVGNGTKYDGLGTLMTGWQALMKTDALIAAVFTSAFLGLALFVVVHVLSATVLSRWTKS